MNKFLGLLAIAATCAWSQDHFLPTEVPVSMPTVSQTRMGVASIVLEAREIQASVDAVVRAIDPTPLAMLDSDLAAAAAAYAASEKEFRRTEGLAAQDQSASQQALEAARARAAADMSTVTLLERRLEFEWGAAFAAQSASDRRTLISAVANGRAALLRADAPQRPEGLAAGRVLIETAPAGEPIAADTLGSSGAADPRMQTIGLYCIVHGPAAAALRPGRVFSGRIETEGKMTGVVIPRSALVRLDNAVWAYVRTGADDFRRRQIINPRPLQDGWFVADGFPPGIAVVTQGAGSLLALERADDATAAD